MRGIISKKIAGKEYVFKFNMNAYINFCDLYTGEPHNFTDVFNENPFKAMRDLFFCALNNLDASTGKKINELPENFSREMVGEWIEEMEQGDYDDIQKVALDAMLSRFKGGSDSKKK
jgi:hypothetical protein